jgi:hypothetical protein
MAYRHLMFILTGTANWPLNPFRHQRKYQFKNNRVPLTIQASRRLENHINIDKRIIGKLVLI